ncbi:tetratricopeptide repeat protein [Myxococcaceae bacterium GXIMD 01537]
MATTRVMGRGEKTPADEEFLQQLYRGGELLAGGKVIEAKDYLERAHRLQPRNEKGQNLLGLAYFKLGLFDRAAELYEMLVRDNPVDPTLRVNLGLVYLKTNALQRAVREFETATDMAPEHKKAHNYLGLALAQLGEYGRAREHFLLAGSDAMAEKMSRAIAGEGYSRPAPEQPAQARGFAELEGADVVREQGGVPVSEAEATASPSGEFAIDVAEEPPRPPPPTGEDWGAQFGLDEAPPRRPSPPSRPTVVFGLRAATGGVPAPQVPAPPPVADEELRFAEDEGPGALSAAPSLPVIPLGEEELSESAFEETSAALASSVPLAPPVPDEDELPAPPVAAQAYRGMVWRQEADVPLLRELAPSVALAGATPASPFVVGEGSFSVRVDGELLTRLSGLVAHTGKLGFRPEMKRFRGRATDAAFGEGAGRLVRASGRGVLFLEAAEKRTFLAMDLGEESAYFREGAVFAFEEPVMFENGRVPSDVAPDLELVHLRGQGRVLLSLAGPLRSLPVREEEPVTVPLSHLVGWQGSLTPRVVALVAPRPGEPLQPAVELSGEGFALITLSVR